jgi:hypothetical protein
MAGEAGGKVEIALAGKVARSLAAAEASAPRRRGFSPRRRQVIVSARSADEIETVAEEIRGSGGCRGRAVRHRRSGGDHPPARAARRVSVRSTF